VLKVTAPSGINLQKIDRRDHTVPDVRTSPAFPQKAWGGSLARAPYARQQGPGRHAEAIGWLETFGCRA